VVAVVAVVPATEDGGTLIGELVRACCVPVEQAASATAARTRADRRRGMTATLAHRAGRAVVAREVGPGRYPEFSELARRASPEHEERGVSQRGGGFGGAPNMQQLMKQAQKMQQQLEAAQAELATTEVAGTAGGGLVTATLLGSGELTALTIDPKAVDPDDVETLQDLIIAAVRDARRAVAELAADKMGPLTGGGLDLSSLGLPGF
jgi:DNA-binding YbaB/EbfC family protein